MKKTFDFPSNEQVLLFEVFGEHSEGGELETLATYILGLSPERVEALKQATRKVLGTIPYKQREVLKLRYGINTEMPPLTREKIGKMFNFSATCARQHEVKARRMCRHPNRIRLLEEFVPNSLAGT